MFYDQTKRVLQFIKQACCKIIAKLFHLYFIEHFNFTICILQVTKFLQQFLFKLYVKNKKTKVREENSVLF